MNSLQQLMLDHSPHMMMLVDPSDLHIELVNRVVEQTLGYSSEQLRAMSITDIESSLQDVFYWEDVRGGSCQDVAAQQGEYRCADGSIVTVMKSVRAIQHEGAALLLVQARDTRHERQVEELLDRTLAQLRATLESTGSGILVLDWHGRITSMNRQFSEMWGIPGALLQANDDTAIIAHIAGQVEDGEACSQRLQQVAELDETDDVLRLKDGRYFECRSRPQYLGERVVGRVFGYTDVTARQRAEEALRESHDLLESKVQERTRDLQAANAGLETERARQAELIKKLGVAQSQLLQSEKMASIGVLAAGVAHEINNPIGFVNSNLGSLQRYAHSLLRLLDAYEGYESRLSQQDRDAIQQLKVEVDADYLREDLDSLLSESLDGLGRVKRIVQDMKDFSHVDGGDLQFADLEGGLNSTLNVVWNEIKYKAEVTKEYANIPQIECYPQQLNQVFMNLLVNAAHAIESAGHITLRTGHDDTWVWVEIEDTGKGIPPDNLSRIFEPFFTTKPVGQGTGLGLSLSYGIVQKHGGRIDLSSEVGKGTRFRVVLPKQVPKKEAGEQAAAQAAT
ncbi:ATP-binding protein [Massilia sp. ZL223]|uniref:ATP-binding protein n=1 Tax=Massilia sp. ZL223 TaxID=2824904 RepID=UPI001B83D98A|nr:ATP-binding protein [Massilia sp. ZL223]MBQ5964770.1 PAS domain S-box protein [Massilia sp. ZL223]